MRVTVKLFGPEADRVGRREVAVELADGSPTVADLRRALADAFPALAAGDGPRRIAVDHAFADDATPIHPDAELALIGQVSGG